jgi:hypothetical protein
LPLGVGQSEDFAVTHKTSVFKFVVLATIAVTLAFIAWSGASNHFAPIDRARANQPVGARPEIAELPNPALSRVRLLVSNLN